MDYKHERLIINYKHQKKFFNILVMLMVYSSKYHHNFILLYWP